MTIDPRVKKAAPWIIGGGVILGIILMMRGGSDAPDSAGDYDPYSPEYLNAQGALALAQSQAGAQIAEAQGRAAAIQTSAQAELVTARAAEAAAIGATYATILSTVSQPQLLAMQEASKNAQATLGAAAVTQLATMESFVSLVNNYVANVNATGQAVVGRVADVSSIAIGAGVAHNRIAADVAISYFGSKNPMGSAGGFMDFA